MKIIFLESAQTELILTPLQSLPLLTSTENHTIALIYNKKHNQSFSPISSIMTQGLRNHETAVTTNIQWN
jgi:hypothetical protein